MNDFNDNYTKLEKHVEDVFRDISEEYEKKDRKINLKLDGISDSIENTNTKLSGLSKKIEELEKWGII